MCDHVIWIYVTGVLVLQGFALAEPGSTVTPQKRHYKTAFCLTHIESNEIYINCGKQGVINLLAAYYGVQEIALDDNPVCSYVESDSCLYPLPRTETLRATCMGQSECHFPVHIIFIDACARDSNFVQVEYQCIPANSVDFGNIADVCGDVIQGQTLQRQEGYIQSLDYPGNYPPEVMCSCHLEAASTEAEIFLETLDVDTFSPLYYQRGDDWLEYTTLSDNWGEGTLIDRKSHGKVIKTGGDKININFRSDAVNEARGFWLNYKAFTPDGSPSMVKTTCGRYKPKDHLSDVVCFDSDQRKEIYLNCNFIGVINVLYAEHGFNAELSSGKCAPVYQRGCTRAAMQSGSLLLAACMGQRECSVAVGRQIIPTCSQDSNYFQVEYQCIPDANVPTNIIDICGDKQQSATVYNTVGYIESLNYPQPYSPDTDCQCRLEVEEKETEIILTVLDMDIDDSGGECTNDYIEYTRLIPTPRPAVKLCHQVAREPIFSDVRIVDLHMKTDSVKEKRGFWIKYYGRRPDGSKSKVKVTCTGAKKTNDVIVKTNAEEDNPIKTRMDNLDINGSPDKGIQTINMHRFHNRSILFTKLLSRDVTSTSPAYGDQEVSIIHLVKGDHSFVHLADQHVIFGLMVGLGVMSVLVCAIIIGLVVFKYKRKFIGKIVEDRGVITSPQQSSPSVASLETGYGSTFNSKQAYATDNHSRRQRMRNGDTREDCGYIPEPDYDTLDNIQVRYTKTPSREFSNQQYFTSYKNAAFEDEERYTKDVCFDRI